VRPGSSVVRGRAWAVTVKTPTSVAGALGVSPDLAEQAASP
jgi:hypothetical protein